MSSALKKINSEFKYKHKTKQITNVHSIFKTYLPKQKTKEIIIINHKMFTYMCPSRKKKNHNYMQKS